MPSDIREVVDGLPRKDLEKFALTMSAVADAAQAHPDNSVQAITTFAQSLHEYGLVIDWEKSSVQGG